MNFRYKLAQFFYGRYLSYGIDALTVILTVFSLIISIVNIFVGSILLYLFQTALLIYMIFRLLSKNIAKRQKENKVFADFFAEIKASKKLKERIKSERNTHVYKKCPHCKVVLRLPRKPGDHTVKCPRCGDSFKLKVK